MRIVALSDSHGNSRPIVKAMDMLKPDAVFFLGDGAREAQQIADSSKIPFYIVKGNCDFGYFEQSMLVELRGKRFFLAHGHQFGVKYGYSEITEKGKALGVDMVLFGHSHISYEHYENGLYLLNPGSCAFPRNAKSSCGYVDIVGNSIVTNIVEL